MNRQIKKYNSSGVVRIQGDKIFWDRDNNNILEIDIKDIFIIGEYTNSDGPYLDDWFLTLVTADGQWQSISMYADNIDELTQYMTEKFREDINESFLANSTKWKSVIRYPTYLKGKALFSMTPSKKYKAPKTYLEKALMALGLGNFDMKQTIKLSSEVENELTKVRE